MKRDLILGVSCIVLAIIISSMMRDMKRQVTKMELKVDSMTQELDVRERQLKQHQQQLEFIKQKETPTIQPQIQRPKPVFRPQDYR